MEVVRATHNTGPTGTAGVGPGGPFQRHDVQEWQHLDQLTGVLETARRESGCWKNDQQQYGKVVDSCSLITGDGSAAQRQLRQLEVYQSRSPAGASLQVIRAHTHTKTSSTRWGSHSQSTGAALGTDFENLQLALNPLDLSSQKTKASVGRSGSIGGRRPPSRPRSLTTDLSRICQQLHEQAVTTATTPPDNLTERTSFQRNFKKFEEKPSILERQNGDGRENFDSLETVNGKKEIDEWRSSFKNKDLDTGRRLSTALRNTNVDLEALDQILKSISTEKEPSVLKKRQSFITAESLQEVRGRLRKLSSSDSQNKEEEPDDGIVAEDCSTMKKEDKGVSRVRSYVYGMEASIYNKKPIIGTGSLESRTSNKSNGNCVNRSEDWYNRRKSYGFEQVHNQQSNNVSLKKNKIESSTDSGICRSTEIVVIPSVNNNKNKFSKIGNSTVINLNGDNNKNPSNITNSKENELFNIWNKRSIISQEEDNKKDMEQITITIPIISEEKNNCRIYRQIPEIKRHSIAVDETKYVDNKFTYPRRTSLAAESSKFEETNFDQDDDSGNNLGKKQKKVEFCKTEVHFAAESGRVNIVETDEKPPPTQNFRRRRRNSLNHEDFSKNDLPLIHFGDDIPEPFKDIQPDPIAYNNVTVSSISVNNINNFEENHEYENPPRGILKNKMIKPKPYLLGDENNELIPENTKEEENTIWGVRLRPVHKEESPQMWRSTVTVQNTTYKTEPEFQKLLYSLRPSRKSESCSDTNEVSSPDPRRSSWSVADRVKQVEDMKLNKVKGYSTRINFGSGEATVVENGNLVKKEEKIASWPKPEETFNKDISSSKSSTQSLQKKPEGPTTSRFDKINNSEIHLQRKITQKKIDLSKNSYSNSNLSSPSLVGNSIQKTQKKFDSVNNQKQKLTKNTSRSNFWGEKPDLLQFSDNRDKETSVIQEKEKKIEPPIYENIDDVITNLQQMEKESAMLQELTKAADQILQAVNGYTDEDSKVSTDSEDDTKKHRLNLKKTAESLSTISETKSWTQQSQKVSSIKTYKVKPTSSTSSIESVTRETKPLPPVRMNRAAKLSEAKKKTNSNSEVSRATRARRLQRASSREALLQSHGSSSEDITSNAEVIRKPRLIRRTKTQNSEENTVKKINTQSVTTRRTQSDVRKTVERVPVVGLQEIRHKTAVSTIRSTAEKNAMKAKEELKKKGANKSSSSSRGLAGISSSHTRARDAGVTTRNSLPVKKFVKPDATTKY